MAGLVGPVTTYFFLTVHYFNSFFPIAQQARQSGWIACLLICALVTLRPARIELQLTDVFAYKTDAICLLLPFYAKKKCEQYLEREIMVWTGCVDDLCDVCGYLYGGDGDQHAPRPGWSA